MSKYKSRLFQYPINPRHAEALRELGFLLGDEKMSEETADSEEIAIAKKIGNSISGKFNCPTCSLPDHPQPIYVLGDFENELYCPHCDMTIELVIKL